MSKTCPECYTTMERVKTSSSNYFFVFTTRTYFYEHFECPSCDYKTEKESIAQRSFTGFTDWDRDEDE